MKVTSLGIIQALKNIGLFLTSYLVTDIRADPTKFLYAFMIFVLLSTPSDLYLLNKAHEDAKGTNTQNAEEEAPTAH